MLGPKKAAGALQGTCPTKRGKENHRLKSALRRDMLVHRRVVVDELQYS